MARIDLMNTAFEACFYAGAGYLYGLAHDVLIMGIPEKQAVLGKLPITAAKACAVSYLAFTLLRAFIYAAYDSRILNGRNYRSAGIIGTAAWGVASIIAFRRLNIIAGPGTAILSGFLALKVIQLMNA